MSIDIINPATGKLLKSYEEMSLSDVNNILQQASDEQQKWAQTSLSERQQLMHRLAALIREKKIELAEIITNEMGKPITQAIDEIEKCASLADYYADETENYLTPQFIKTENKKSYVCYKPLGVIFAIMPWNFPFWQVLRFAIPNLMAGNAGILKHAPNSTGAALAIQSLFEDAGFPKFLFNSLVIDVSLASNVIEHPVVKGITLTGSNRAGQAVAQTAGKVLKKVVLELGGSDPYLILEDADLDLAVDQCVKSRLNNAGQVCIAAKRIIVVDAIRDEFINKIKEKLKTYQCGDPMLAETTLGPMAREDLMQQLDDQVQRSIKAGVECAMGGKPADGSGFYYPTTLFLDVKKGTPAYDEELFGPVVCIINAKNTEDAIKIANDTPFGLGAAVFTKNIELGETIARDQLNVGTCNVNSFVTSDPRLPFGGTKESGYGRELASAGVHEFMNAKTVVVA